MGSLLRELRYAVRRLTGKPGFAIASILTLGLGVGATTALFTVLNSVVLRPLALKDPQRLVMIQTTESGQGRTLSDANFTDFRAFAHSYENIEGYTGGRPTLTGRGDPEVLNSTSVTTDLLPMLGNYAAIGRTFTADEQKPESRVAVLSHDLWQRKFAGDRNVLGSTMVLDGNPYTIIGVLGPGAGFPRGTDLWTPLPLTNNRFSNRILALGRLREGVSVEQARIEADGIGRQLQQYPENKARVATAVSLTDLIVGPARESIWLMFGAVAVVLLIGCANVANLQIVRAAERGREIAVRLAIGAGRAQIVRHLFTESLLVALAGGALGIALAGWGVDGLLALKPRGIPRLSEIRIEGTVLLFALGVSILSAVFFGLWPAWRASKLDLNDSLKQGGRANSASVAATGLRSTLGVVQIALALVLLVGASLLLRSLSKVLSTDLGFRTSQVLSAQFTLPAARYPDSNRVTQFHRDLIDRLSGIPGIISASVGQCAPLEACYWTTNFSVEGEPPRVDRPQMNHYYVMPKYFSTLGIALLEGRDFTDRDVNGRVTVVSKRFAREYLGGRALGRRVELGMSKQFFEVIGVADDVHTGSIEGTGLPQAYFATPYANSSYVIRTQSNPAQLINAVRAQIHALDPELAIRRIQPIEENVREAVAARRFQTLLLTAFASIAAILAVIGIYSVLAYSASQRTQEIGVRMALGASATAVRGLFLRQALVLAGIGLLAGIAASTAAARALAGLLYGVKPTDPLTYAAVALLFLVVAMLASWIPAWRASRVDPVIALRHE